MCVGKEWEGVYGCVRCVCGGTYVWGACVWGCMYRVCLCAGKEWGCVYMGVWGAYEGVYTDSYGAVEEGDGIGAVGVRRGCRGGNGHPQPAPRPALTCRRERGRRCPHPPPSPPAAAMAPPVPARPGAGLPGPAGHVVCGAGREHGGAGGGAPLRDGNVLRARRESPEPRPAIAALSLLSGDLLVSSVCGLGLPPGQETSR